MHLKTLKLTNFRNYEMQTIDFTNGINLFLGPNAQGKTNIIEAVYLLALGKSYRVTKDIELIKFGSEFCRLELEYVNNGNINKIEIYVDGNSKVIKEDGVRVAKLSEHVGKLLVVIFSPDSLDIVKGAPQKRRRFLDMICSQLSKSYLINLQEYMKCLKLKNKLLKLNGNNIDRQYISILHQKMSVYIEYIVNFRSQVLEKMLKQAVTIHESITDKKELINIEYVSDFIGLGKLEIEKILDKYFEIDIYRKSAVKGIQKDDFKIYINNLEVDKYCSQGQNRTALLTLKLAKFEVLKQEKQTNPILLLDDIMSELDSSRIAYLLKYIEKYQSIITTTDASYIKSVGNMKISKVLNGTLEN